MERIGPETDAETVRAVGGAETPLVPRAAGTITKSLVAHVGSIFVVGDTPLSICGELAGRPEHIARLLKCGIRTFSVAPPLIPIVKEAIRNSLCA